MKAFFRSLLALTALVAHVSAFQPVHPGTAADIVITKDNTLNATTDAPPPSGMATIQGSAQLPLAFVNKLGGAVNVYVSGQDSAGRIVMLQPNGQFYYPTADSSYTTPREINGPIAIALNTAKGSTTRVSLPDYISSARIWFAQGNLHFYTVWNPATKAPSLVEPSFANPQDPSSGVNWGFVEFTNNSGGVYANLSYVDFVGLPAGMTLTNGDGSTQSVSGLRSGSVTTICNQLQSQQGRDGQPWGNLCQAGSSGPLRAVAPYDYLASGNGAFSSYYNSYVDQVWNQFANNPLTINHNGVQTTCRTSGNTMTCSGDNRGYNKPTAGDIFGCNSGPFAIQGGDNSVHYAVVPVLCAAFHRSTYLVSGGSTQPGPPTSSYYGVNPTNYYAKYVHQNEADGRGYAFAYDDVNINGGVDQSGALVNGSPRLLSVNIGGA